ncbi:MAG: M10 family metallopeptidase C-terminal domain-containing protein [Ferrovibrio sp.]|nr:M10 family metallopeptidase C-terminal domain-containing protein [Ferrovibrio sp.]
MATQSNSFAEKGYGSPQIDSLVWGAGWQNAASNPIGYYFSADAVSAADSPIGGFTGQPWTTGLIAAFESAIGQFEAVANVKFVEVTDAASADMVWHLAPGSNFQPNVLGQHDVPDGSQSQTHGYFNIDAPAFQTLTPGSVGNLVIIHELGHGMGLAHPHDGGGNPGATLFPGVTSSASLGTYALNQGVYTTMSYNNGLNTTPPTTSSFGAQGTLMALDIAALQRIYGANTTTASGDDTYALPTSNTIGTAWQSVWDTGGNDTVDASASTGNVTINLNAATLSGATAGGSISQTSGVQGGLTIANKVVIENATGGSGNDTLVGNAAANVLTGGAGKDTMSGGAGNDTYYVDNTADKVLENVSQGADTVIASASYTLGANVENLVLVGAANGTGNSGINTITGNALDNVLNGGAGSDTLIGGLGNDTYVVDNAQDRAVEAAGEGDDTVSSIVSYTLRDNIENLTLTGANPINGTGNAAANVITGNRGNNTLNGGAGADTLIGGLGNDVYVIDDAGDVVVELANQGNDSVQASISYVLTANIEHLTLTGRAAIDGTGNSADNHLIGNEGANVLSGGAGKDRILGGGGNDTISGGAGQDTLTGGGGADVFMFTSLNDSPFAGTARDTISDLNLRHGDRINLSAIDADTTQAGDQDFVFITGKVFTAAGQVMVTKGLLTAEVNGDGVADFAINLVGVVTLADGSFLIG